MESLPQLSKFRAVLLKPKTKDAFEKGWQQDANYTFDDVKVSEHVKNGGNLGILTGYNGLVVLDCDDRDFEERVKQQLPPTLTVRTGSGGAHYYLHCPDWMAGNKPIVKKDLHVGDLKAKGGQVVAPGSTHPNGNKYVVENSAPVAQITADELKRIIGLTEEKPAFAPVKRDDEAEQVKQRVNLFDYGLKPGLQSCTLPGHKNGDTHPSLSVSPDGRLFNCFSRHEGGDVFTWLKLRDGLEFKDALTQLKTKAGITAPDFEIKKFFELDKHGNTTSTFYASTFADELLKEAPYKTLPALGVMRYNSQSGLFEEAEPYVRDKLKAVLGELSSKRKADEVIYHISVPTDIKLLHQTVEELNPPTDLIALDNGVLNWKTGELQTFSPEWFFIKKLPVAYNPDADCPKIKAFLREITESEEDALALEEYTGYCLLRETPFPRAFFLIGGGNNGKSTFIKLVETLLGEENVSNLSFQELSDYSRRFSQIELYGKLLNTYADLQNNFIKETGRFKALTGGDRISGERKFQQGLLSFAPYAKNIFSCNELPEIGDDTDGFFRRVRVIRFPKQFKDNPGFFQQITTPEELQGFLNLALAGLNRLLENNNFTGDKTTDENRTIYKMHSTPESAFVTEKITQTGENTDFVPTEELYSAYLKFCKEKHTTPHEKNAFSRKFQRAAINARQARRRVAGVQTHGYIGVKLEGYEPEEKPGTEPGTDNEKPGTDNEKTVKKLDDY